MSDLLKKVYTDKELDGMTDQELLKLRNLCAKALGVAEVKEFKDHATAVDQTKKALTKYQKKPEKKPRGVAKAMGPETVKRPTREMFDSIKILKQPEGKFPRAHRWPNYKDGMLVIDAREGDNMHPWDINEWCKLGLMKRVPATDAEYAQRRAAWFKKQGREDPELKKNAAKS